MAGMKPILYAADETAFASNGIGRLHDMIECVVTEERNGIYECDFSYPVDGARFDDIQLGRIIGVTHDDTGDVQPFDIVSMSRPIGGVVSFHAVHLSYRQSGYTVNGTGINSLASALTMLKNNAQPANPFTYEADYTSTAYMSAANGIPRSVRQMLGGIEGSILDAYHPEYEFDRWNVIAHRARGQRRDFTIRYGLNLSDYTEETDYQGTYTSCIPYWSGGDGGVVVIGNKVDSGLVSFGGRDICIPLDLTDKFENKPTKTQLQNTALSMMQSGQVNLPSQNISVDFVRLQDFEEFAGFSNLLQCRLCDSINVIFPRYNMQGTFKIVRTEWDVLKGRYKNMELGNLSTSLADALGINQSNNTNVVDGLVYVNNDGDVEVNSDLDVVGGVTLYNHSSAIGYTPADISGETASIASGSTLTDTAVGFTLDAGVWVLVASVRYATSNTGYRGAAWGYNTTDMASTRVRSNNMGASYSVDLQPVAIVTPTATRTYTVRVFQTSGAAMTVTINARAVRIA